MSEEKPEPKTVRTPDVDTAAGETAGSSATLKSTDSTPTDMPIDTVYTRPTNPSPASAIVDPDNDERRALREASRQNSTSRAAGHDSEKDRVIDKKDIPKTKGESAFNRRVYLGIGWAANAALSVAIAYGLQYTKWGKEKAFPAISKATEKVFRVEGQKAHNLAELLTLMIGGTSLMIPIKLMEDQKRPWVKAYNEKHGSGIDNPVLEKAAEIKLDQEPKQTWASVLSSRGAVLALVGASSILIGKHINKGFEFVSDTLWQAGHSKGTSLKIPENLTREALKSQGITKLAESSKSRAIADLVIKDIGWSAYVAKLLFAFTRIFGGMLCKNEGKEPTIKVPGHKNSPENASVMASPTTPKDEKTASVNPSDPVTPSTTDITNLSHQGTALAGQEKSHPSATEAPPSIRSKHDMKPEPMASYRDLAAQSQISGSEPARA